MQKTKIQPNTIIPPVVREYDIKGIKYIVTATVKAGVKEDAATKIRRLIRNEIINTSDK